MSRLVLVGLAVVLPPVDATAQRQKGGSKPDPTKANVAYGEHPRLRLDFWKAKSEQPTPLVLYIHGGGFRGGDKRSISGRTLQELLDAGISIAAINYRLTGTAPLPTAHHDCRRALQFLRHHAKDYNIDKSRVGAFGGSAGAQLCMYLAFHDDMADPEASDPVLRESTRLACVATSGGQTTMDVAWWIDHVPGYDRPHRDFRAAFKGDSDEEFAALIKDVSALSLISNDDPPIFMRYGMKPDDPVPENSQRANGWKVHHVVFGVELKKTMDTLGVEAHLLYPGSRGKYRAEGQFFIDKLQ